MVAFTLCRPFRHIILTQQTAKRNIRTTGFLYAFQRHIKSKSLLLVLYEKQAYE
jgi:hypothetical protein